VRRIYVVVGIAFVVSVVHYVDNYVNYDAYPEPTSGPAPSATVIGLAWFLFTAFAIGALVLLRQGRQLGAALCLAVYSISGLIGIGHYTVPGALDMPWWRQAHVLVDVVCGVAVLAMAIGLVRSRERVRA
jgi:hypothetical protein